MPVPEELIDAVRQILDEESAEPDSARRAELLARVRGTLDAWQRGQLTTAAAVVRLATGGSHER